MKKILVIGATGMLGKPVTHQLIREGFEITILARNPEKAQKIFPGARIVKGDVFDVQGLVEAFAGQDEVYLSLSILQKSRQRDKQTEREDFNHIVTVGKQTCIKRIVYLSSVVHWYNGMNNFRWWAFDVKQSAVDKIKKSGIPYTIFYPSTFMETYPYQMKRGKKIGMMGISEMPMWFIAASDYAWQVARSFALTGDDNREYTVQGPEAYTFDQATQIFIDNYKKEKLSILKIPLGLVKFFGHFNPQFSYVWHICESLNKYPEKFDSEKTWAELGKPTTLLKDYASSL